MIDDEDDVDPARTAELIAAVQAATGSPCAVCAAALCGHDVVLSIVLGSKDRPRCLRCAPASQGEPPSDLAERALQWIVRRPCFQSAWLAASATEGHGDALRPACLWPEGARAPETAPAAPQGAPVPPAPDAVWDAGSLACGDLVLELRQRLRAMPPGAVLALRALDPGAPQDIPAWCGLTRHTLLFARHPDYWIRRRSD